MHRTDHPTLVGLENHCTKAFVIEDILSFFILVPNTTIRCIDLEEIN
jgi:hypothetical protein